MRLPCDWPTHNPTQLGNWLPPSAMVQSETSLPEVCSFGGLPHNDFTNLHAAGAEIGKLAVRLTRFFWQPSPNSMP